MRRYATLALQLLAAAPLVPATRASPTLFPVDFGADSSGTADSTAAFQRLVVALLSHNTSGHILSGKVVDLGGATVDLQGGDYLLSAPLAVPNYFGNYRIIDGSLRASLAFPADKYVLELGGPDVCPEQSNPQYSSCAANVGVSDLLLDGGGVALGGVHASYHMGLNAGPNLYIINFTTAGVMVTGGHEVMLHSAWIGSKRWEVAAAERYSVSRGARGIERNSRNSDTATAAATAVRPPLPTRDAVLSAFAPENIAVQARAASASAAAARARVEPWLDADGELASGSPGFYIATGSAGVVILSNDHYLSDVVVFSGPTYGVVVSGAANLIQGTHVWNRANTDGGYGIVDTGGAPGGQNRYIGCYMDYNDLIFYNPNMITAEGGFFLCGGHVILVASGANAEVNGVSIFANQYGGTCGKASELTVEIDVSNGTFATPVDVTVRDAAVQGPWVVTSTTATRSISSTTPISTWTVDFTAALLFNTSSAPIVSIAYSFTLDAGQFAASAARKPPRGSGAVTVETDKAVSGTLTVTVDQSARTR